MSFSTSSPKNAVTAYFGVENSNKWIQTITVPEPKLTTVGELNLLFGQLTSKSIVSNANANANKIVRLVTYKGNIIHPDTLVHDLLQRGQKEITFYFIWRTDDEIPMDIDQERIDDYFNNIEFEMECDEFIHDLDFFYEDEIYTELDHAERKDTMDFTIATQKAAIKRKYGEKITINTNSSPDNDTYYYGNNDTYYYGNNSLYNNGCCYYYNDGNYFDIECQKNIPIEALETPPPYINNAQTPEFSLCIPRAFTNINEQRVRAIFRNLCFPEIEAVDFVKCSGKDKHTGQSRNYNRIFVHFKSMCLNQQPDFVRETIYKIFRGEQVKFIYDEPWFWLASISKSPRPVNQPAPPKIVLNEEAYKQTDETNYDHAIWSN